MTCTVIGFVDVWALVASLRGRRKELADVSVRGADARSLHDWPILSRTLDDLDAQAAAAKSVIEEAELVMLAPQTWTPWLHSDEYALAVVPLVTNPACFILSGPSAFHGGAGEIVLVEQRWPACVVNWGTSPHIHLMLWLNTVRDE